MKQLNDFFSEKKIKFNLIKLNNNELNLKNSIINGNIILGWNNNNIYYGMIIDNNIEIIDIYRINNNLNIKYVSFDDNYIFFSSILSQISNGEENDSDENMQNGEE